MKYGHHVKILMSQAFLASQELQVHTNLNHNCSPLFEIDLISRHLFHEMDVNTTKVEPVQEYLYMCSTLLIFFAHFRIKQQQLWKGEDRMCLDFLFFV